MPAARPEPPPGIRPDSTNGEAVLHPSPSRSLSAIDGSDLVGPAGAPAKLVPVDESSVLAAMESPGLPPSQRDRDLEPVNEPAIHASNQFADALSGRRLRDLKPAEKIAGFAAIGPAGPAHGVEADLSSTKLTAARLDRALGGVGNDGPVIAASRPLERRPAQGMASLAPVGTPVASLPKLGADFRPDRQTAGRDAIKVTAAKAAIVDAWLPRKNLDLSRGKAVDRPLAVALTPEIDPAVDGVPLGERVVAPFGAVALCERQPETCAIRSARGVPVIDGRVVLSSELRALVALVNARVNRAMKPKVGGPWHVGGATGDCKDYALTKRDRLNSLGFPTSATLVATATARNGRAHAVLIVRTDGGDLVLDNLVSSVRRWSATDYVWDKIQSPADPAVWLSVPRVVVAAIR